MSAVAETDAEEQPLRQTKRPTDKLNGLVGALP